MGTQKAARHYEVIVIGGGASGLMAAISAARSGARTLILDHHKTSGKKILSTGNGKCNFTNLIQEISCYRCEDPSFVQQQITAFSCTDVIDFFYDLGVLSKDRNGYCYPRSGQAVTILQALLAEAERTEVNIQNEAAVTEIRSAVQGFEIRTKDGLYRSKTCILACGGKAAPKTGSDGSGYVYAKQLGHALIRPLPALVPLITNQKWIKAAAGVRSEASITLYIDQQPVSSDRGETQWTDYGISGIPVFQVSRYAARALEEGLQVTANIDLMPEYDMHALWDLLAQLADRHGDEKSWQEILNGLIHAKLSDMILRKLQFPEGKIASFSKRAGKSMLSQICETLKQLRIPIVGTKTFEQAQVTCGGIPVSEIKAENLESKLVPGLFFAGEMIDVDAICGGYNLQWAWSTGYLAGKHAAVMAIR